MRLNRIYLSLSDKNEHQLFDINSRSLTITTIALKYDLECDFVYSNNSLMIIQQCISWTQK